MQKKRWIFALAIVVIGIAVGVALYFLVTTSINGSGDNCKQIQESGTLGDIIFSAVDTGLEVTWTKPAEFENCNVSYIIEYTSDLTDLERQYDETFSEHITIPHNMYCFRLFLYISAYVYDQYISGSAEVAIYLSDLEEPQELVLIPVAMENILVAAWQKDDKQEQCNIQYNVLYEYGGFSSIFTTNESAINLDIAYCTEATVQVSAVTDDRKSNATTAIHEAEDPITLGPVQNTKVAVTGDTAATIFWDPPEYASHCTNLEYIVNARNGETGEEESCGGKSTCSLNLRSFCSATTFTVQEISGITEEISFQHICV